MVWDFLQDVIVNCCFWEVIVVFLILVLVLFNMIVNKVYVFVYFYFLLGFLLVGNVCIGYLVDILVLFVYGCFFCLVIVLLVVEKDF